ncbi:MAG: dihydropteroate synthase [Thiohalomonadaceae bacterium]
MQLDCRGRILDLSRPQVMGILNVTPDSFSDGGRFHGLDVALAHAVRMAEEGAAIIDVGGESTRPGSEGVSLQEELDRVIPVIERLHAELPLPISVDTSKPEVMKAAVAAGAGLINDVYALRTDGAPDTAASLGVPVCLMHMQGEPRTMQHAPNYRDVVAEVREFLDERMRVCEQAGISREKLLIDPGFGFGKNLDHNLSLLRHLPELDVLGVPLLVGVSRKSMIGAITGAPVDGRLQGSVAAATLAAWLGARILRVHDVKPTVDALKVVAAVQEAA